MASVIDRGASLEARRSQFGETTIVQLIDRLLDVGDVGTENTRWGQFGKEIIIHQLLPGIRADWWKSPIG